MDPFLPFSDQEPSTSYKYPPSWPPLPDTLLLKISTWNFHSIFLRVKKTSSMTSRMTLSSISLIRNPQHPQVPSFLTPHSWHTSNKDINTKLSGYLPWDKMKSSLSNFYQIIMYTPPLPQNLPQHQFRVAHSNLPSGQLSMLVPLGLRITFLFDICL